MYKIYAILLFVHLLKKFTLAIDCFKCISINHDYQACEDPFHNNFTLDIFESPCMGGRKGRDGLFPATACIKITGEFYENGTTIIVRGCALDSGTLTTDTEIVRMSHCGGFYYGKSLLSKCRSYAYPPSRQMFPSFNTFPIIMTMDGYVRGCVQSCNDADACNNSQQYFLSRVLTSLPVYYMMYAQLQY